MRKGTGESSTRQKKTATYFFANAILSHCLLAAARGLGNKESLQSKCMSKISFSDLVHLVRA